MKDNLPILEVKALGGFSMRYGEKTISIGSGKSTKAVKLLQILVCSEGRTVSRERLLDMLYGNEDITDAANNLRVTTFRLKKMLVTAGLPQYDYIQIKSGMYSLLHRWKWCWMQTGLCHCATRQMRRRMPKRRSIC